MAHCRDCGSVLVAQVQTLEDRCRLYKQLEGLLQVLKADIQAELMEPGDHLVEGQQGPPMRVNWKRYTAHYFDGRRFRRDNEGNPDMQPVLDEYSQSADKENFQILF